MLASGTEILYGLGLGDRVIAVSHECDFPAQIKDKPRVTFTNIDAAASSRGIDDQVRSMVTARKPLYRIDVERLAALRPDLIVTQAQCEVCAVDYQDVIAAVAEHPSLRGAQVVALNPITLEGIFDDIRNVATAAERREAGERFIAALRERVEQIRLKTAMLRPDQRQRVACLEWLDPPMVAANWMPELVEIAGGRCELTQASRKSTYTRWDDVAAFDPEVIVLMPCGFDLDRTSKEAPICGTLSRWNELSAVRRNRVYAVDGNALFNRSGPRIVDSLELLAALLHPQVFPWFLQKYAWAWTLVP